MLRRERRRADAREPLRQAVDVALRCGAPPLADRVHQELLATGARPRRRALTGPEALTPTERRVAEMTAGGMSNREVARAMFVTMKTVETHLARSYRKLEVHSREELRATLAGQAATAPA